MERQRPSHRSAWFWITLTTTTLILLYAISFGPLLWFGAVTHFENRTWYNRVMTPLYEPHLMLVERSEDYFTYATWWVALANPAASIPPWEEWKKNKRSPQ